MSGSPFSSGIRLEAPHSLFGRVNHLKANQDVHISWAAKRSPLILIHFDLQKHIIKAEQFYERLCAYDRSDPCRAAHVDPLVALRQV
jgi:hypothetical protein